MKILRSSEYFVMPWKNGQGSTTQLYIWPPHAPNSDFDLRISVAKVAASGPFSLFPGIDRIITQLTGPRMTIRHPGESGVIQLQHFEPYRFPGELATEVSLDGEASDFNVMTRRGVFLADMDVLRLHALEKVQLDLGFDFTILFAAKGSFNLCTTEKSFSSVQLLFGQTAVVNEDTEIGESFLQVESAEDDSVLLVVKTQRRN